jgi:hypothetical protein
MGESLGTRGRRTGGCFDYLSVRFLFSFCAWTMGPDTVCIDSQQGVHARRRSVEETSSCGSEEAETRRSRLGQHE